MGAKYPLTLAQFYLVCDLVPMLAVELVFLRNNRSEILLTKRPPDDKYWPGQWHVPGGYLWRRESIRKAIHRVGETELGVSVSEYFFLGPLEFETELENPRNHTVSHVYVCSLAEPSTEGEYFPLNAIPENLIEMHRKIITLVRESPQTQPIS